MTYSLVKFKISKSESDSINLVLSYVEAQIGIKLKLSQHFMGLKKHAGLPYFNVQLENQSSESDLFKKLESFSQKSQVIKKVETNGFQTAAIFLNPSFKKILSSKP